MTELLGKLKKRKFYKEQKSFSDRYKQCNRCGAKLNIFNDEEIICAVCGETFCGICINKHQRFCFHYE